MSFSICQTAFPSRATICMPRNSSRLFPSSFSPPGFAPSVSQHAWFELNPLLKCLPVSRQGVRMVAQAGKEPFDASEILTSALEDIQEAWAKAEDKVALGIVGFSAFLTVWACSGVVNAINQLPLLPGFFELVGTFYSIWFAYHYLLFKPDREKILNEFGNILKRIVGSEDTI